MTCRFRHISILRGTPFFALGCLFAATGILQAQIQLSPNTANAAANGNTNSVQVMAQSSVSWTAASNLGWLRITSPTTGNGGATINYIVDGNPAATPRVALLTVTPTTGTAATLTVSQPGGALNISPASANVSGDGGGGTITVITEDTFLQWTAVSSQPWLTITAGGSGVGPGPLIQWSAAPADNSSRTATITVTPTGGVGQIFNVNQSGANVPNFSISPSSANADAAGGNAVVQVLSDQNLTWTATSDMSWLVVTGSGSGSGPGSFQYSVAANPNATARSGTITVNPNRGPRSFLVVSQAGGVLVVSPASDSVGAPGGTGNVSLTTTDLALKWTVTSNAPWLTIPAGGGGTGPATVTWSASVNALTVGRSGLLTITPTGGTPQTVSVNQAAAAAVGTISVNPSSDSVFASISIGTAQVTATDNLTWTASSSDTWLTITSDTTVTGSTILQYRATGNPTAAVRTATITLKPTSGTSATLVITQAATVVKIVPTSDSVPGSGGGGSFNFTTNNSTQTWTVETDVSWLSLTSATSGKGDVTNVWSAGINPGGASRVGHIIIRPDGGEPVVFTVTQRGLTGTFMASPASLSFSYQLLGDKPRDTQVTLTGQAQLPITITTTGGAWLTVSSNAATIPAVLNVAIVTAGLAPGTYNGSIQIASDLATNPPVTIPVTLMVTAAPVLTAQPNFLVFSFQKNATPPVVQMISLTTDGTQLAYTIVPDPNAKWLSATGNGPAPSTLTVSVNTSGLQPATYHGDIIVSSPSSGNGTLVIPVTLTVTEATPALIVSPASLSVGYRQLQPPPKAIHLSVTSSGDNVTFTASISPTSGWLSVVAINPLNQATGKTPGDVQLAVDPTGLAPGSYQSSVVLSSAAAGNGPLTVPVTLTVLPAASLGFRPERLSFSLTQGDPAPYSQSITVSSDPALNFTAAASAVSGGNWLTVAPLSGRTPATVTVTVQGPSLPPGIYTGSVVLTATQNSTSVVTIPVTLTVLAQPTLTVLPTQLSFVYQLRSGPPPTSQPVIVGTSNLAAVPVTATVATTSGANWLAIPVGFVTPSSMQVGVIDPSRLTAGTYSGSVTLSSPGYLPATIPVTLQITNAPALTVTPATLNFNYQTGSTSPLLAQSVALSSSGAAQQFSVAPGPGSNWVSVTGGGQTPASFSVSVNPLGFAPGGYDGSVLVTAAGAGNSPVLVLVHLNVTAAPIISSTPSALSFTYTQQRAVPTSQALTIYSRQPIDFSTSITASESWLILNGSGSTTPANFDVSVDPDGLIPGHYSASITINAPGAANSLSIPVSLTVVAASLMVPSPTQFVFSYQNHGELPANQVLTVTSSDSPLGVSATAATVTGGSWLTVTGGGPTPAVFSLNVNPAGLAVGSYQGSITLSSVDAGNNLTTVPVTLVVAAAAVMRSSPDHLNFSYQVGNSAPSSTTLQITSSGDPLAFRVASTTAAGGPWLSVTTGGTTPLTVTATVDPTGLAPGTYSGTITLTSLGGNSPFLIPVTFTVSTSTLLSASPASLQFVAQEGGQAPVPQVVQFDTGGTPIAVTYQGSPGTPWLTFSGSPTAPGMLTVAASPTGLAAGLYSAVILVQSDFAANSPLSIPIAFEVSARPVLSLSSSILRFAYDLLGTKPPGQSFTVNSSGGAQGFTLSTANDLPWLFASGTGTTPAPVSVTVDPGILTVGEYQGTVLITPSGSATPIQVQVILTVTSAPVITAAPTELAFAYQINGTVPAARSLVITSDRGSQNVSLTAQTFTGGNWLLLSGGGPTPAAVTAAVNPTGLPEGVYREEILVNAPGVSNSPLLIPVSLTVSAAPALNASPSTLSFAGQANGSDPPNQQVTLTSSDGSALPIISSVVSSGTWLTLTGSSSSTPDTLTIAVSAAGLSPGIYQASLVISSVAAGNTPLIIPVTFTVANPPNPSTPGPPILTVSQPTVVFSFGVGGAQPPPVQLAVNSIGAALTYQTDVAPGAPWLSVSGSGPTPSALQITANPTGLPAGSFHGTVIVTSPSAANGVVIIPVDLVISGSALLNSSASSLTFTGGSNSTITPQSIQISSTVQSLTISATPSPATPWLSVSGGGSTPQNLTVSVNPTGLSPGTYQGTIQIIAAGAGNSPFSIPVTLVVQAAVSLQATPSPVTFAFKPDGTPPPPQIVGVTLGGQPAVNVRSGVAPGVPWLTIDNSGGGNLHIAANPAGLLPGVYNGSVVVAADGAANSPLTIPVTLVVGGSPEFDISQESLAFTAVTAQSQPITTTITLDTGQNAPVNFTLSVTASTWLSITPLSGMTPTTSTITVDPTGLRAGSYSGSVIVTSSNNVIRTIPVNLTVADAPTFTVSPPLLEFAYAHGGNTPPPVNVYIGRFGADVSVTASTSVPWLTVNPTTPSTSGPIKVQVVPTGLAAGIYQGTVFLSLTNSPAVAKQIPVTLYIDQPANPQIFTVSNGMSFLDAPLSPGLIFSVFGTGLGPATAAPMALQSDQTLSQSIAGVQVLVNGIPCPLLYVSSVQINAIAPYSLFNKNSARVAVSYLGTVSSEVPMNVSPSSPGLFSFPPTGRGAGAILNQDQSVNTSTNPAAKGTIISLFGGGGGQTSPPGIDGLVTANDLLPKLLLPVSVTIAGVPATDVQYAGAAPGFPSGSLQVNVRIPASVPSGDLPVVVTIGNTTSQSGLVVTVK